MSRLYRVQLPVQAEPTAYDMFDDLKSRLDLRYIDALPSNPGSAERTTLDPSHGMARAFGLSAAISARPRPQSLS
jgi:hypothetical protein